VVRVDVVLVPVVSLVVVVLRLLTVLTTAVTVTLSVLVVTLSVLVVTLTLVVAASLTPAIVLLRLLVRTDGTACVAASFAAGFALSLVSRMRVQAPSPPSAFNIGQSAARPWPGHASINLDSPSRTFSNSAIRRSTSISFACAERFTFATSRRADRDSNSRTSFNVNPSTCARRIKRSLANSSSL
jgi:hypothetical protein